MSNRKVERVWLQSPIDVAGLPGATTQISPEKTPGASIWLNDLGLEVTHPVKNRIGETIRVFIPIANVKVAVLESEAQSDNS